MLLVCQTLMPDLGRTRPDAAPDAGRRPRTPAGSQPGLPAQGRVLGQGRAAPRTVVLGGAGGIHPSLLAGSRVRGGGGSPAAGGTTVARAPHTHRTLPAASIHTTARAARKKRCPNWRSWATAPEPPNLKHKLRHATTGQHGRGAQINSTYNEKGTAKDPAFDAMSLISISRRCLVFLGRSTLWFDVHGRVAWLI